MKDADAAIDNAIAAAWNVQSGRKVYPMNFGTSDVDGIRLALKEYGYRIVPTWGSGFFEGPLFGFGIGCFVGVALLAWYLRP